MKIRRFQSVDGPWIDKNDKNITYILELIDNEGSLVFSDGRREEYIGDLSSVEEYIKIHRWIEIFDNFNNSYLEDI